MNTLDEATLHADDARAETAAVALRSTALRGLSTIVLECTNMPSDADALRRAAG